MTSEQQDAPRTNWKTAEIAGVVLAVLGGVAGALAAIDSLAVPLLWTAIVLALLGAVFSGAATFLAPRGDVKAFTLYTGWGLVIGVGVLFWVVSELINAAGL
ncbi:MAG: hypothetical protein J7480_00965 [Microbacteriaceae bacterium]|nr:hypothetical protein [Microbacteriaceae bacterium]